MSGNCGLKLGIRELGNANNYRAQCQYFPISQSTPYALWYPLGGAKVVAKGRGVGDAGEMGEQKYVVKAMELDLDK